MSIITPSLVLATLALLFPTSGSASSAASGGSADSAAELPFGLDFSASRGGLHDAAGAGTGFPLVLPGRGGVGHRPELLRLDTSAGRLRVQTSASILHRSVNTQENALGVNVNSGGGAFVATTELADLVGASGAAEQAGLWVGLTQDDYAKVVAISVGRATYVHFLLESRGQPLASWYGPPLSLPVGRLSLRLRVDPARRELIPAYAIGSGPAQRLESIPLPASPLLTAFRQGSAFAAGIFATHRRAPESVQYAFDGFGVACVADCRRGPAPPTGPDVGSGPPVGWPTDPRTESPPDSLGLAVRASRKLRLRTLRRRGLRVVVRCAQDCRYRASLGPRPGRRLGGSTRPLTRRVSSASVGRLSTTWLRPSSQALRRLAGARPRRLVLRVQARFAGGQTRTVRRPVTVRP